jgi:hypothetical protein
VCLQPLLCDSKDITITFPIKLPADAKAIAEELPPLMPDLPKRRMLSGLCITPRFLALSDETFLFLADIDGELENLAEV